MLSCILLGAVFAFAVPILHMQGKGLVAGRYATNSVLFFWVWTNIALGASGIISAVLAAQELWRHSSRCGRGSDRGGSNHPEHKSPGGPAWLASLRGYTTPARMRAKALLPGVESDLPPQPIQPIEYRLLIEPVSRVIPEDRLGVRRGGVQRSRIGYRYQGVEPSALQQ